MYPLGEVSSGSWHNYFETSMCFNTSLIFTAEYYTILWMGYYLYIHSSIECLDCFQFGAITIKLL